MSLWLKHKEISNMRWVAPTEKDTANQTLEKRLWAAADQFRANFGLKAEQHSASVLGLIFQ
jgi:type I restriction enzyme M protein